MLKKAVSLLFLLAILFAFSGCDNVFFSSADNLMRPPKISGDINSALRTEFEKSIGGSYALKYPASGEYQSPYIMYDLDKDGQDEAVVFYSLEKDNTSARMALFDYTDDKWNLVSDIKGLGNSINSVSFEDMGNNGRIRLVVSWGFFDTKTANILAVYSLSSTGENKVDTVQQMFSEPYAAMKIFDVDGDGVKEIFLITDIAANDTVKNVGRLFTVRPDGSIAQIGAVTMDSTVSGYSSVKLEPAAGDKPYRIFVDAKKGDISMSTEVIYWDKKINGLSSPLLDVDTQSVTSTVRNTRIESRDINGDGILEIPLQMSMKNDVSSPYYDVGFISSGDSGEIDRTAKLYLTKWSYLTADGEFVPVAYSAINSYDHYSFNFKAEWVGKITAESDAQNRTWTFYGDGDKDKKLFSISTFSADKQFEKNGKLSKIGKNGSLIYGAEVFPDAGEFGIDIDVVKQQFEIIA